MCVEWESYQNLVVIKIELHIKIYANSHSTVGIHPFYYKQTKSILYQNSRFMFDSNMHNKIGVKLKLLCIYTKDQEKKFIARKPKTARTYTSTITACLVLFFFFKKSTHKNRFRNKCQNFTITTTTKKTARLSEKKNCFVPVFRFNFFLLANTQNTESFFFD